MDTAPSHILIIEDDVFLSGLLAQRLRGENFACDVAQNGEIGLGYAKTKKPSLILLDLLLPGVDGYEVLKQLKADPECAKIPVIILSNLSQEKIMERGFELGASGFMVKAHNDLGEIVLKIKEILSKPNG